MKFSPSTNGFYLADVHGANMPADVVEISDDLHAELLAAQSAGSPIGADADGMPIIVAPAPLSVDQRAARLLRAVDKLLQDGAALRRYDSIVTAALRAAFPGPWHAEGVAYATWMDACYARCYELLAQFQAGEIAEPTEAELVALMPALELPA